MRILLLSQWYYPEPADVRIDPLAASLLERGHQVKVITGFPNYPLGRIYEGYKQRLWQRENRNGIDLIRLPVYPDHSRSAIRRALTYLSFAFTASVLGVFFSGKTDVMLVYQPPLTAGIPGLWISFWRRIPFVYEIQDMWPETVVASGMMNASLPIKLLSAFARFVFRHAAAITVISPGFRANLQSKGVPGEKVVVIPNWADESIYQPVERDLALGAAHQLDNHFNVIFAGIMGPSQRLLNVIEAAEYLRDLPAAQFVLIGDGVELPDIRAAIAEKQLTNVRIIDRQPPKNMPHFLAWGDALLVQLRNDPLFHMTIPSKTLAYLACGRPIICAVPGDGADVIREAGAGLICPPDDPKALAETVRKMYETPAEDREMMGKAGRAAFLERFTRQKLVSMYEAIFEKAVEARS